MKKWFCFLSLFVFSFANAQTTHFLKVHFLYGSTPKKQFKDERKWFGGKLGGHVGIEDNKGQIFSFVPNGTYHVFQKKKDMNSRFIYHDEAGFYSLFGNEDSTVKKAIVYVPINEAQKEKFDSISRTYRRETPYDYAFFGMRCGAAAYDVLAQLGILKSYSYTKTWRKIFYPKKLRKRLFKLAKNEAWKVEEVSGSSRRNWEQD